MTTLYGIKNCDTVKKARKWLEAEGVDYRFHDFREDGIEKKQVEAWVKELGWDVVVNKRSTSWKALEEEQRSGMNDSTAVKAILAQPTLIKRPLLDTGKTRHTGFKPAQYSELF